MNDRTAATLVALGAGVFLVAVLVLVRRKSSLNRIIWILIIGAIMRLVMMPSSPILEDDFYRYLWDGAVTSQGINPYQYSPHGVIHHEGNYPRRLDILADQSREIIQKINHPHIRTIYPPVAQGIFALSYLVKPWSITTLRSIIVLFDVATALLLLLILQHLRLPLAYINCSARQDRNEYYRI